MDSQEVLAMLEQCHTAASEGPVVEATEEAKLNCQKYRGESAGGAVTLFL